MPPAGATLRSLPLLLSLLLSRPACSLSSLSSLSSSKFVVRVHPPGLSQSTLAALLGADTLRDARTQRMVDAEGDGYTCYLPLPAAAASSAAPGMGPEEAAKAAMDAHLAMVAQLLGPAASPALPCIVSRMGYWR